MENKIFTNEYMDSLFNRLAELRDIALVNYNYSSNDLAEELYNELYDICYTLERDLE